MLFRSICWTNLISGFCENGLLNEAWNLFDSTPLRNDVTYSATVSGYVKNGLFNEGMMLPIDVIKANISRSLKSIAESV